MLPSQRVAHFEDLQPCTYGFPWKGDLLSVGWLERGHAFTQGAVDEAFVVKLRELLKAPWAPVDVMGPHFCDLCPPGSRFGGVANLFIPSADGVFVAPELLLHYVEAHRYRPPERFITAVLECPPMRSEAYLAALDCHQPP